MARRGHENSVLCTSPLEGPCGLLVQLGLQQPVIMDEGVLKIYSNSMIKHAFLSHGYFLKVHYFYHRYFDEISCIKVYFQIKKKSIIYHPDFQTGCRMLCFFTNGSCWTLLISFSFKCMKTIVKRHQMMKFKKVVHLLQELLSIISKLICFNTYLSLS